MFHRVMTIKCFSLINAFNLLIVLILLNFLLIQHAHAADYPFYDPMDTTTHWTMDSPWAQTNTDYHSATAAICDSPSGAYANNVDISLTLSDTISLVEASHPMLVFWHQYEIETEFDYGYLEITTNEQDWILLAAFTGISNWKREQFDLSTYIGEPAVRIRFRFVSDKTVVGNGWTIDDITIAEPPNPVMNLSVDSGETPLSLQLSWTKSLDANFESYQIYRSQKPGVTQNSEHITVITDADTLTYSDSELNPETKYYYKVYVFNTNDLSSGSREISATTGRAQHHYPFFDDMEGFLTAWTPQSPWSVVTIDAIASHSGITTHAWTDSPDGAYAGNIDSSLQMTIDLGAAIIPVLSFKQKFAIEENADFGYVEVKELGTESWVRLYFITGTSAAWHTDSINLSSYAGKEINIRFRLTSDNNSIQSQGWYIDDISIDETQTQILAYPFIDSMDIAETINNWHTSSWELIADPHSGNFAITDSRAGNSGYYVSSELILANSIDMSAAVHPQLTFWHKYDIINCPYWGGVCGDRNEDYDDSYIFLSTYKGQSGTWKQIATYRGTNNTWSREVIDLANWAGLPDVRIKFVVVDSGPKSGSNFTGNGWTIDDVIIEEAPIKSDITITKTAQNLVALDWTKNTDLDFSHYEIHRSKSADVTLSSDLIISISDQAITAYTDIVSMVQPDSYYYRMWVFDQYGNISWGSNVVHATYSIPQNTFPFVDNAENGTTKWSWGDYWGLTDKTPYDGNFCWTDSPGSNYDANANTTLTMFINLSGTTHPIVTFWHRYFLESGKDFIHLEVSTDEGITWQIIRSFSGTETKWNMEHIDLSAYAGQSKLGFRFHLTSDSANQQDGWYMDNISIQEGEILYTYPFEDMIEDGVQHWFYTSPWSLKTLPPLETKSGITSTVWTDSPEGSYASGADSYLYFNIDLGSANMPVFTFWHRYALESNNDWGFVEIQELGSSTWQRLYGVTGTSARWLEERVDLSNYAGKQVSIRFHVVADSNGIQSDGWYIDNMTINETPFPIITYPFSDQMDEPNTLTNWHSSSWERAADPKSGIYAFTDSPEGNSGKLVQSTLILSNVIDLRQAVHPQLTFWQKYDITNCPYWGGTCGDRNEDYDSGIVYLSTFNGQPGTWTALKTYTGEQNIWQYQQIDLTPWAGLSNVRIKFDAIDTNALQGPNFTRPGWTIDDVTLEEAPVDVAIQISETNQHKVVLTWTQNTEPDFERYEIYRSTAPEVTRNADLIMQINDQEITSFQDNVAMIEPTIYYYRMWVIDKNGNISMGSNEIHGTYTIPSIVFPIYENAENGTNKWSWGSPWGISDNNPHSGQYVWTDSPGANYQSNANTTLTTYLNLGGTIHPILRFWHRYFLEENKDFLRIEISTDNGLLWTLLRSYSGTESDWNMERIDLSAYAGHAHLGFRFRLVSDDANQQDGWYMDDMSIIEEKVIATYPFIDDVEGDVMPWFYNTPWGVTNASSHSGNWCWTDSPNASYQKSKDSDLTLTIDLGASIMPVLSFWHRYAFEVNNDWGYVEVKEVGSQTWIRLYMVTGTSSNWLNESIDLSNYAGKQIYLRYRITSNSNDIQSDGWYIDDITIDETKVATIPYPFVDNMDTTDTINNWHSSSWELTSDAHSGTYAWTDSPLGNYGQYVRSVLILSSNMNLSKSIHPTLSFVHKYDTNDCPYWGGTCGDRNEDYDYGYVYLSTFNGQPGTWTLLASFKGQQTTFVEHKIDLSPWAGLPSVRIKFEMADLNPVQGSNSTRAGWTVDDIRIGEDLDIPTTITITSGDGQIGETGTKLEFPFVATVYDVNSMARPGIEVTFDITSQGGALSTTKTISDKNGQVIVYMTLGTHSGANTMIATVKDTDQSVIFTATSVIPGPALRMSKVSGDNQVGEVNMNLNNPFVVKLVDVRNDPVKDALVGFSVHSGSGSLPYTEIATDENGIAMNTLRLSQLPGKHIVMASVPGLIGSPITFSAYAVLPGGNLSDLDGDGMPNEWEIKNLLSTIDPADALTDTDGDGLSNIEEFTNGLNPNSIDTDHDLMPDGWELFYGLDPLNPEDASDDPDQDGMTNLSEFYANTPPIAEPHFQGVVPTDEWIDIYGSVTIDGIPADKGDEVGAFDPDGVLCGVYIVSQIGQYGFMHVYKDDPNTKDIDEGANPDDAIVFRIWDVSAGAEIDGTPQVISGTQPPSWTVDRDQAHIHLNGAGVVIIPLHKGWNLFSYPMKTCFYVDDINGYDNGPPKEPMLPLIEYRKINQISDVLQSIEGKYSVIRGFDRNGAHTYDPELADYSDLKYIAGGYGYWINMTEDAQLHITGMRAKANDQLALHSGWNLIGYWHPAVQYTKTPPLVHLPPDVFTFQKIESIQTILFSIKEGYHVLRTFDASGAHTFDPLLEIFSDMNYLAPGYGIWVKMKTVGVLTYAE